MLYNNSAVIKMTTLTLMNKFIQHSWPNTAYSTVSTLDTPTYHACIYP